MIRYDGVGDTVVLAPLLAALAHAGHELGLVTSRAAVDIFRADIVRSHVAEDGANPHAVFADVRARAYDVALIATEKPYAYTLAKRSGIPRRIGFWNGFAKPFKSIWVRRLCTDVRYRGVGQGRRHEAAVLFDLGRGLHAESAPTRDVERLCELFFRVVPPRRRVFAVQITPKWLGYGEIDAFAAMLRELALRTALQLIGAASEEPFLAAVEQASGMRIERHGAVGGWIERIASSRILLTPDTGAAHVAGMVGTKVIDCFPAGTPVAFQERWRPWAAPAALIEMDAFHRRGTITAVQEACAHIRESLIAS